MKVINLLALSAKQKVAINAARMADSKSVVTGNFCSFCKCCKSNQNAKGFVPDPGKRFDRVCSHCAKLRAPNSVGN